MSDPNNQNPTGQGDAQYDPNDPPVFNRAEVSAIVQQRLAQDRSRRGNPPPSSSAPASAAPTGIEERMGKMETMFATLIERLTPAAPAAAPQAAAPSSEPAAPRPPAAAAAAPNGPNPHTLPTNMGLVDIWNMTPHQIDQLGPQGIRREFEKHKEVGNRLAGAPTKPRIPWTVDPNGTRIPTGH